MDLQRGGAAGMQKEYVIEIPQDFLIKAYWIISMTFGIPCILLYILLHLFDPPAFHPIPFVLLCALFLLLHMLLHALGYRFFGKVHPRIAVSSKRFGCLTDKPMSMASYRASTAMPSLLLGWLPLLPAFFLGDYTWFLPVVINICFGARDYLIIWELRFFSGKAAVMDLEDGYGCRVSVWEDPE